MQAINFETVSEDDFEKLFGTNEKCLSYLAEKKWINGFVCKKCGNTNYCAGKMPYSRRCTRCKHDESAKVDTIFENCRFDLTKAFHIAYCVCHTKECSSYEFSRKLNLRQMTCWAFKKKLSECVKQRQDITPEVKIKLEEILLSK